MAQTTFRGKFTNYLMMLLIATGMLAVPIITAGSAGAVHDESLELDGDVDPGTQAPFGDPEVDPDFDWTDFFSPDTDSTDGVPDADGVVDPTLPDASLPGFTASGFSADYTLPDTTTFTQGSKDTLNISDGWTCTRRNNLGGKIDILNAYSTVFDANGETILYFGIETASPNGNNNAAVWFLQDRNVGCENPGGGSTAFTGDHVDGDILLVSAFTNGGTQANVAAYEWQGGPEGFLDPTPIATGALCSDGNLDDNACAITNATAPIATPWNSPDKDGGSLNAQQFFEGGLNLTASGILGDRCFATFVANTRQSQSITSSIFDFAAGSLDVCEPSTTISVDADDETVFSGDAVTLTITETNDGNIVLTQPTVTAEDSDEAGLCTPTGVDEVDNEDATDENPDGFNDGDTDSDGELDAGESWLFSCTFMPDNDVTITAFGHGTFDDGVNPPLDVTWVDECAGPDEDPETPGDNPDTVDTDDPADGTDDILCDLEEVDSVDITVLAPSTTLFKTAQASITYTYEETNDGNVALEAPSDPNTLPADFIDGNGDLVDATEENGGWVVDDQCSPVLHVLGSDSDGLDSEPGYNIGDVGDPATAGDPTATEDPDPLENNNRLDPGETWLFTCEYILDGPDESADPPETESSVTNEAIGHGRVDSGSSDDAVDVTYCDDPENPPTGVKCDQDERDVATVSITYGTSSTDTSGGSEP